MVEEICECGGTARPIEMDGDIVILQCDTCYDSFEAHEDSWAKEES